MAAGTSKRRPNPAWAIAWDDLAAHLFPGANLGFGRLPISPAWTAWEKPRRRVAIDDAISALVKPPNGRKSRLLDKEELRFRGIVCPYFFARTSLLMAPMMASIAAKNEITVRETHKEISATLRAINQLEPKLYNALERSSQLTFSVGQPAPGSLRSDIAQTNSTLKGISDSTSSIRRGFSELRETLEAELKRRPPLKVERDIAAFVFVERMAELWIALSGSPPSVSSQPFMALLSGAYDTLLECMPEEERHEAQEISWAAQSAEAFRTWSTTRPFWDQIGHHWKKGPHQPGASFISRDEWIRRSSEREARWLEAAKHWFDEFQHHRANLEHEDAERRESAQAGYEKAIGEIYGDAIQGKLAREYLESVGFPLPEAYRPSTDHPPR